MGQDSLQDFLFLGGFAACGEGRPQAALVTGEHAFGLPTPAKLQLGEATAHLAPVLGLGPLAPRIAFVDGNNPAGGAQFFPAESLVVLGVVPLFR